MPIPIPKRPSGFTLGAAAADVTINAFVDIQCPHSKAAWPTLLDVLEHYHGKSVSVTVHLMTLSNHRQAWDMSLGLFAVAEGNAKRFFDFASFLFERQQQFDNAQFKHKTHEDLRLLVADFAYEHCGLDKQKLLARIDQHDIYIEARTPIRYAATRAVWATPTLFINNADDVPVNHQSTLDDWIAVIDPIL